MTPGRRVRVTDKIRAGFGSIPAPGTLGRVERQLGDGTVIVNLDDGRRALLASWEIEEVVDTGAN